MYKFSYKYMNVKNIPLQSIEFTLWIVRLDGRYPMIKIRTGAQARHGFDFQFSIQ